MPDECRPEPDRLDAALAYAEMVEAVENGYLGTAISLSREQQVPLQAVWTPEDDNIDDDAKPVVPPPSR